MRRACRGRGRDRGGARARSGAACPHPASLAIVTTPPGLPARALGAADDEALTEASFQTADFAAAERLFTEARELAARDGDREREDPGQVLVSDAPVAAG